MQKYCIDLKGQKRRLHLGVGDVVVFKNLEFGDIRAFRITGDYDGRIGADCLFCTTSLLGCEYQSIHVVEDFFVWYAEEHELRLVKVIKNSRLRDWIAKECGVEKSAVSSCTWQQVLNDDMRELHAREDNPKIEVHSSADCKIDLKRPWMNEQEREEC